MHKVPPDEDIDVEIKDQDDNYIPMQYFETIIKQYMGCANFMVKIELSNVMTLKVNVRIC